jgi:hypothetical protein
MNVEKPSIEEVKEWIKVSGESEAKRLIITTLFAEVPALSVSMANAIADSKILVAKHEAKPMNEDWKNEWHYEATVKFAGVVKGVKLPAEAIYEIEKILAGAVKGHLPQVTVEVKNRHRGISRRVQVQVG